MDSLIGKKKDFWNLRIFLAKHEIVRGLSICCLVCSYDKNVWEDYFALYLVFENCRSLYLWLDDAKQLHSDLSLSLSGLTHQEGWTQAM